MGTDALPPGALLPSEPDLVSEFGVARGTIRSALNLLEKEGRVVVVPGVGRRVAGSAEGAVQPASKYELIAAALRSQIDAGEFNPRSALPSESALMAAFDVSRNTVRRAYEVLEAEGRVVIRHGAGVFLATS